MEFTEQLTISDFCSDENLRHNFFPVVTARKFFSHAGVAPLPRVAVDALVEFAAQGSYHQQESEWDLQRICKARENMASFLGCATEEVALIGPTSFGLSLVANGLSWEVGDELICYWDDYPANVYPWLALEEKGVKVIKLKPEKPGHITAELVQKHITSKTRLVALASCHFLTGYRININEIGKMLRDQHILFSLDAIQTLGAFPTPLEYVDFASADSHKWMLGPVGAGIFYVRKELQERVKPTILGSWNVISPNFIPQPELKFYAGARRYESGTLNLPGICGMEASALMLRDLGLTNIGERLLALRKYVLAALEPAGYCCLLPEATAPENLSGIITVYHPEKNMEELFKNLAKENIHPSLRKDREGNTYIRISPHFYNTEAELDQLIDMMIS